MTLQICGYKMYLIAEMVVKATMRSTLREKKPTDIHRIQSVLYGRLCKRIDTMPVPIVTVNQLWEKSAWQPCVKY